MSIGYCRPHVRSSNYPQCPTTPSPCDSSILRVTSTDITCCYCRAVRPVRCQPCRRSRRQISAHGERRRASRLVASASLLERLQSAFTGLRGALPECASFPDAVLRAHAIATGISWPPRFWPHVPQPVMTEQIAQQLPAGPTRTPRLRKRSWGWSSPVRRTGRPVGDLVDVLLEAEVPFRWELATRTPSGGESRSL